MISFVPSAKLSAEATIILLSQEQVKSNQFSHLPKHMQAQIKPIIKAKHFSGKNMQICPFINKEKVSLLVGLGSQKEKSLTALRICIKTALESQFISKMKSVQIIPQNKEDQTICSLIEGIVVGTYAWKKYKTKKDSTPKTKKFTIVSSNKKEYQNLIKISQGVNFTRDLVNDNADLVTADYMENIVKNLVKAKKNVSLEILGRKQLTEKGLNLHLAVNQGSNKEPKLIIVKYQGAEPKDPYTAIIGKGITFDTGGLNLKPSGHIETMREDMGGSASVLGVLKNALGLNLKKNVLFVCGMAENAIGSGSYKPGDVVKSYSGKTVEIGNTDAEGRLVLADAIAYTVKNYKPERIIDIATLTGACVVALGYDYSAIISPDDSFAEALLNSAKETDDRAWRLPIYPEVSEALKSQIADIKNIGYPKGAAGTITAGEFLRQFTNDTKWAHLDIAGTAFVEGAKRLYFGHGATGSSVRLLTHYLMNN